MTTKLTIHSGHLFSEEQILEQVRKIFLSPSFSVSEILRRFLTYIVRESIAGRTNTIKEYTIAINVLNKPLQFKPQLDAIVRIHAGRLRRALKEYYQKSVTTDKIVITIPKGGYIPEFSSGWYEGPAIVKEPARKISGVGLPDVIKIAVLPFESFETDIARIAFTNSLGEQLSAELGKFADFSVLSYYTAKQLDNKHPEIEDLAARFGVQFVLTGNVLFADRKLRVSVQLTDAGSGIQIWTRSYHFPFISINHFQLGDKIIAGVIGMVGDFNGIIVQQAARQGTKKESLNPSATTLGRYFHFYSGFNVAAFKTAYAAMKQAVDSDARMNLSGHFTESFPWSLFFSIRRPAKIH